MPLFRRRRPPEVPEIDYDRLAKAISPAIARAGAAGSGAVRATPGGATYPVPSPSSPFSQTGGGIMEIPLPRPDASFNSLFGPGYPLIPDPLDPVGPNGRVGPRRSEYLVAWNLQLVDRQVPWTMLRWLAEDCDVVNRCIQLTQDEQCGLDWGWGFSDQILYQIMQETGETNSAKATQIAREKYGDELLNVQRFFEHPDKGMNQSFVDWLQALLWDHLVYDGVAIYPRYNLGGELRHLELVDASTIKIYRDNAGRVPEPPAPAYAQILYGFPRGEFQHTAGEADDEFTCDQMAYFIRRPRNTTVYGYPQVEEVMALATTYLGRQAWMRAEYTHGATPKMLVETSETESWTPEQLAYYEQMFNDRLTGQIERRQMAFFLRPGMKADWAPQIDEHYKSDYDNWLIAQIGSRFGRPPTMLGVQAKAGLSGGKQQQGEMDQSDIYSGKALTGWLVHLLNTCARRYLGVGPEITARVNGGGTQEDQLQETQAMAAKVNAGWVTRNEARAAEGRPLIDEPEADQLAITTGEGVTFLTGLLKAQEQAQQLAATPPTPPPSSPPSVGHAPPAPVQPDTGGGHVDTVPASPAQKASGPVRASGLVVKADDTGRVLMVQRAVGNQNQRAAGLWEWPGGKLDGGDTAFDAAKREWEEEVGIPLPSGKTVGQWEANGGRYVGFVYVIKSESLIELSDARGLDGSGDSEVENVSWWDPADIVGNSAVRIEVQSSDWALIGSAKKAAGGGVVPKALADRKAAEARAFEHHRQAVRDAMRGLHPAAHRLARKAAADYRSATRKAAGPDEAAMAAAVVKFRQSLKTAPAALVAALTALKTDAWVIGVHAAHTGSHGAEVAAGSSTVDPGIAWDDWQPGAEIASPPAGLAAVFATLELHATQLAAGQADRMGKALLSGLTAGATINTIAQSVADVADDTGHADMVAGTELSQGTEQAAQAAYQAAGFDRWRTVLDGTACALCESYDGVHDAGATHPPFHPRCGCGSEPVGGE